VSSQEDLELPRCMATSRIAVEKCEELSRVEESNVMLKDHRPSDRGESSHLLGKSAEGWRMRSITPSMSSWFMACLQGLQEAVPAPEKQRVYRI